jgi:hypothetical protein
MCIGVHTEVQRDVLYVDFNLLCLCIPNRHFFRINSACNIRVEVSCFLVQLHLNTARTLALREILTHCNKLTTLYSRRIGLYNL